MSTTIDQRVVEMRFDNQHFEKNVQTSMSTLDKLKQSLNLTGASKGLESINAAAKNNNMGVLGSSVEAVHAKFSALQVMGVTALANITNSAVNAGKKMVSALTIDPVKTGLQEYETQINAVQTILANTQSKGTDINDVNKALEELNKYADMTIYNFTEMTRNIGTFTAAGVDLDSSVSAIKGIANLAAVSGSTSQQASTAMYQLSQALATGTVKLQDWNSVVNAGMGGEVFQNALVRTAAAMDGAADNVEAWRAANVDSFGSFRDSLTQGAWLTTDVLTETLNQFTMAAEEGSKEWEEYKKSLMDTGYTEKQAEEILKMANTATDAATKVKTFTQLWDVLKESAQSGWSQTWKLIIGDFEEAKNLLSPLADFLTGAINKFSDARNNLLEGALGKTFTGLVDKVKNITKPIEKSAEAVKTVVKSVEEYANVADEILSGDWGTGQERWDKLTKAGYDWAHAQNLVNEKLGDSTRHATNYNEAQGKVAETQNKSAKSQKENTEANAAYIAKLAEMSDAQLKANGYTEEQIKAFRELKEISEKTGIPLKEFIENIDEIDGRYLLINSFKNAGQGLVAVFKSIGEAWRDAFPPMQADTLFNMIAGLHKFSTYLVMGEETADKLTRTFKGLFAILDIVATLTGSVFKIGKDIIVELAKALGLVDVDILSVTANVGDAIVAFRNWLDEHNMITKAIQKIVPFIVDMAEAIVEFIKSMKDMPAVQKAIDKISDSFKNMSEIGMNIVEGLTEGINGGIDGAVKALMDLGTRLIESIKSVLGIHSPSTVMIAIGGFIIAGLILGLEQSSGSLFDIVEGIATNLMDIIIKIIDDGIPFVVDAVRTLSSKLLESLQESNIDLGSLAAAGGILGLGLLIKKFVDVLGLFAAPLEGLGNIVDTVNDNLEGLLKGVKKNLNAKAFKTRSQAIRNIAISLAIVAASVALLAQIDAKSLWNAVGVIGVLAIAMAILAIATSEMSDNAVTINRNGLKIGGMKTTLVMLGAAMLLMAATVKILGKLDPEQAKRGFIGLAGLVLALAGIFAAYGTLVKGKSAQNISKAGTMIMKLSISLLLLVGVCKLVGMLSKDEFDKGVGFMIVFGAFVYAMVEVTKDAGKKIDKVGGTLIKMSIALGLLVLVAKLIGKLTPDEMIKGGIAMVAFGLFVKYLVASVSHGKDKEIYKVGGMLLAMSTAMLLMVGVCKLVGMLSPREMIQGGIAIAAFALLVKYLVNIVKKETNEAEIYKVGATLIAMSIAIGIMAAAAALLGFIPLKNLAKGVVAVSMLGLVMAAMVKATQGASEIKGTIMMMAVAIGVMAASIILLSFITPEKLVGPTIAMSMLMGMFALIVRSAAGITGSLGPLIVMTVAVGLLGGIVWGLSKLPVNSVLGSAAALSLLLLSMSASLMILNGIKTVSVGAMASLVLLTGIVAILSRILIKMDGLNAENALGNVKALSVLLLAMSGACVILGVAGSFGPAAFIGIGVLAALIVGIGGLITAIGALVTQFPKLEEFLNTGIPIIEKIGHAIGSFFGNIVSGFAEGVTSGLPQIGSDLGTFMTNLKPFIEGAKTIDETATTGMTNLVKMMGLLAGANILESIGSFISGQSSMETFATQMNAFGDAIVSFSQKVAGNINEESVLAAANAGRMLAEMQTLISGNGGVFQFFTGEKDLTLFGEQIKAFGDAIVSFSKTVTGNINEEAVLAAANAGKVLAEMQSKIVPSGGVFQFFTGEKDMITFAEQLSAFGDAISKFSNSVASGISEEAVTAAANAGKLMAEMQAKIVPSGGVVQWFTGEKDMAAFGEQLVAFGEAIVDFSAAVEAGVNEEAVSAAARAGEIMATLQSKIPASNGVFQIFTGDQSLSTFGTNIKLFGEAITDFSKTVSGNIDEEAVTAAANAGKVMATLQKSIPEDKWLDGKVSLEDFGKKIKKFGGYIKDYSFEVAEIDNGAISTSMTTAKQLVDIAKSASKLDSDKVDKFKKIKTISDAISDYSNKVSGTSASAISNSITNAKRLVSLISSLGSLDTSGVSSFKAAINELAKANVSGVVTAFNASSGKLSSAGVRIVDSIVKGIQSRQSAITSTANLITNTLYKILISKAGQFSKAGVQLMDQFSRGLTSQRSKVSSTLSSVINSASSSLRSKYSSFYSAGSYLVSGFASGISANTWRAEAKARAMANAAEKAAKEALDINSPSRVFAALGSGVVEGFVKGIDDNMSDVSNRTSTIAETARTGFSNAIGRVSDLLNGDMDVQPTITPVLDLSEVTAGAKSINGMFGMTPSVGVLSNLGAINTMMNSRQNGNSEVVSAINKLRKELGNVGGDTYNVNGITYDDGSNVSNAVKDIIRYTRIEGRV